MTIDKMSSEALEVGGTVKIELKRAQMKCMVLLAKTCLISSMTMVR